MSEPTPAAATQPSTNMDAWQKYTLPGIVAALAGAGYGSVKAPGGSRVRGGLIGGGAGLGAGLGFTGTHAFLGSEFGKYLNDSPAIAASLYLAGTGLGGAAGLHGGRQLSKQLGLGDPRNQVENDLEELNMARSAPISLRRLLGR